MEAGPRGGARARAGAGAGAEAEALRRYYRDHTLFLSPEWIFKVFAVIGCVTSSALLLGGAAAAACAAGTGGAGAGLAAAGVAAAALAAAAARLPARAPTAWLIFDITTSTVMGVLLLVTAVASAAICDLSNTTVYLVLPLSVVSSALSLAGATATYRAATSRLDAALPAREPRAPPPIDHDV